jgi:hypothetical protein
MGNADVDKGGRHSAAPAHGQRVSHRPAAFSHLHNSRNGNPTVPTDLRSDSGLATRNHNGYPLWPGARTLCRIQKRKTNLLHSRLAWQHTAGPYKSVTCGDRPRDPTRVATAPRADRYRQQTGAERSIDAARGNRSEGKSRAVASCQEGEAIQRAAQLGGIARHPAAPRARAWPRPSRYQSVANSVGRVERHPVAHLRRDVFRPAAVDRGVVSPSSSCSRFFRRSPRWFRLMACSLTPRRSRRVSRRQTA